MKLDLISSVESDTHTASNAFLGIAAPSLTGMGNNTRAPGLAEYESGMTFVASEGRLVVVASKGLWVENAKLFQQALLGKVTDYVRAVDLELSTLVRFDTWALCTLLSLRRYFSARMIRFRLLSPSPRVEMVLEMTKTRSLFEVIRMSPRPAESVDKLNAHSTRPSGAV